MSNFDPAAFLTQTTTTVDERRPPLPTENPAESDGCYVAVIGDIGTDSGTIGKGDRIGQPWISMLIPLRIQVPAQLQEALKLRPELTLTDRVFLDLLPNGAGTDDSPGKNRGRKMYREATGLNNPGEPFSFQMLTGKIVRVRIKHEMYQGVPQERIETVLKS